MSAGHPGLYRKKFFPTFRKNPVPGCFVSPPPFSARRRLRAQSRLNRAALVSDTRISAVAVYKVGGTRILLACLRTSREALAIDSVALSSSALEFDAIEPANSNTTDTDLVAFVDL